MKKEKSAINFNLLKSILTGVWMIDERAAISYAPELANILNGNDSVLSLENEDEKNEEGETFNYWLQGVRGDNGRLDKRVNRYSDLPEGSIAVLPLSGPLMKSDAWCGPAGTATKAAMLKSAIKSKNIVGIILYTDSPGGHVDGTEEFSREIREASKPVVAYVDGLMASAAYWIGSSSDYIIAGGQTSEIGSIGTMISLADIKPVLEKAGVKFHDVRASKSVDKNEDFYQLLEGNYAPIQKNLLDPLNEIFLSNVRSNREGKLVDPNTENVLTGKIYLAEKALEYGLIDSIGTMDDAIEKVNELSSGGGDSSDSDLDEQINLNLNSDTMKIKAAWTAIMSFMGLTSEQVESEENAPVLTEENLEQLNSELESRGSTLNAVNELFGEAAQADDFNVVDAVKGLQDGLRQAQADKSKVEEDLKAEKAKPKVAVVPDKTGNDNVDKGGPSDEEVLDSLPHNQVADEVVGDFAVPSEDED